jgi:hypothetical protein
MAIEGLAPSLAEARQSKTGDNAAAPAAAAESLSSRRLDSAEFRGRAILRSWAATAKAFFMAAKRGVRDMASSIRDY